VPEGTERDVLSAMKMSKSKPDSAVFIHDQPDEISRKISKAFCPPGEIHFNPVLDWVQKLVFALNDGEFRVDRSVANGGDIAFESFDSLAATFAEGKLHPMDLKAALSNWLIALLEPARKRFAEPEIAVMLSQVDQVLASS
jgi:tyrosyl-tRNA synthetase